MPKLYILYYFPILLEKFIPDHGVPEVILSDLGTEYQNALIDELSSIMRIERRTTTAFHPEGNALVERAHATLNSIIAKGLQECRDHSQWEKLVPGALFAMRTSIQESRKFTPFFLANSREINMPLDTFLKPKRK